MKVTFLSVPEYCLFDLQIPQVGGLSIETVGWIVRLGQRAAADAGPTCGQQTTREEFRTLSN